MLLITEHIYLYYKAQLKKHGFLFLKVHVNPLHWTTYKCIFLIFICPDVLLWLFIFLLKTTNPIRITKLWRSSWGENPMMITENGISIFITIITIQWYVEKQKLKFTGLSRLEYWVRCNYFTYGCRGSIFTSWYWWETGYKIIFFFWSQ